MATIIRREAHTVEVDYGKNINQLRQAGNFAYCDEQCHEQNFPRAPRERGCISLEIGVVSFGSGVTVLQALQAIYDSGMRPCSIRELLALTAAKPAMSLRAPIVALGSFWLDPGDNRRIPYVNQSGPDRGVSLDWGDETFDISWRFAVVKI